MDSDASSLVTGKVCPRCQIKYSREMDRCPQDNSLLAIVKRDPFVGKVLADKYQIVEILGMGGFATVYKAEQKGLIRSVAIKILHAEFIDKQENIRRFQQEAESIGTLIHTNVAAMYDYGVTVDGQPYLVMELVTGTTLQSVLDQSITLNTDRAVSIFLQACDGIAAAHAMGLIHRDLKPSNIMLDVGVDGTDHVKILDFGLAKVISEEGSGREQLTMTGDLMGTPAYMAPEQCMGVATDQRTDVYSFGCVMYEMLSGKLPIGGDTSYEMMNRHINEVPRSLSKIGVPVPPKLVRIVSKALQKDPDDRYQDFEELKDALSGVEPALTDEFKALLFSSGATKLSRKKRSLKKKILLSAWTLLLVAIGAAGLMTTLHFYKVQDRQLAMKLAGQKKKFDYGMLSFECPAIYSPTNPNDTKITLRLMSRISNNNCIDFKQFEEKKSVAELAAAQRTKHQDYKHFVETMPIQAIDFGKGKLLHGYMTEFCGDQLIGFMRERHIYFGKPGALAKIKIGSEESKDSKFNELCDTVLNTIEFHPKLKLSAPKATLVED